MSDDYAAYVGGPSQVSEHAQWETIGLRCLGAGHIEKGIEALANAGVAPSTERGRENQGNRIMGLLGIPITNVTPGMQESERRRQLYEQNALRNIASGG